METSTITASNFPYVKEMFGLEFSAGNSCGFDDPRAIQPDVETAKFTGPDGESMSAEVISYRGDKFLVHGTNNLLYVWEAYIGMRRSKPAPSPEDGLSGFMYRRGLEQNPAMVEVLDSVAANYEELFSQVELVYQEREIEITAMQHLRAGLGGLAVQGRLSSPTPNDEQRAWRKIVLSYSLEAILKESRERGVEAEAWCR